MLQSLVQQLGGEVGSKSHPVNPYRSKVELNSTAFSAVTSRMSGSDRHVIYSVL